MAVNGKPKGYTHKGTQWEYQQSWYLLALFTPWFYWFPLVYTGLRVLQFRWIVYGLFYGLPAIIKMFFDPADFGVAGFFKEWIFAALAIAAIHSLRARGEYLVRLANAAESREILMEGARMRREQSQQAVAEVEENGEATQEPAPQQADEAMATRPARRLFDVNQIGERELAMLPGMGPVRAREAMALRESLGSYHSFDHFAEKMGLSTDARERLRPIFIQPEASAQSSDEYTTMLDGRSVLEINLASARAIATLPGLDDELARRAVTLRDADGPYVSVEDFRYRLGLSMDVLVQIAPIVSVVKTPAKRAAGMQTNGRVVDTRGSTGTSGAAAVKPSGRIVDL